MSEEKIKKKPENSIFFPVGDNLTASEDPSYVEYN